MRFIGNKTRLLDEIEIFIKENIKDKNTVFCDLFAGTGSVGTRFKEKYKIISNDYLYFSYILSCAYIENSIKPKFKKLGFDPIDFFNKTKRVKKGFFYKNYSPKISKRMYFSDENALKIDFIRSEIEKWKKEGKILDKEYKYLLAVLIESVSKVANIAGVYGSFLKIWDPRAKKALIIEDLKLKKGKYKNISYNKNASDLIKKIKGDVLYIDPPYTKNEYSTQYHVLETLAKWDNPKVTGITGTRPNKEKSDFSHEYKVLIEFEKIIANANFKYIVLSYSDKGLMKKAYIEKILKKYAIDGEYNFQVLNYRKYANHRTSQHDQPVGEYLFFIKKKQTNYIESPLNYMGSKYKMLNNIFDFIGKDYVAFVDVFGGGFNVGINSKAKKIIYNDTNFYLKNLIEMFKKQEAKDILIDIKKRINTYGLKKKNKDAFVNLRKKYNKSKKDILDLYLLLMYGFQQQFRFNSKHEFNNPVGMSDYNENTVLKIIEFSRVLKEKNIILESKDFEKIECNNSSVIFYCDPPYYITLGSYNDGKRGFNGWGEKEERRLYAWLDKIDQNKQKFVLSNVLINNNKENSILKKWLEENNYAIEEIDFRNRKEILVKNY